VNLLNDQFVSVFSKETRCADDVHLTGSPQPDMDHMQVTTAGIVELLKSLKTQSHRPRWHSKPHIQDLCQRISWSTAAYLPSLIRPRPRCCSRWLEGSSHSTCFQERRLSEPSKLPTDLPHLCLQQNNETCMHSSIMFMLQSISNATTFYQTNNMASVKKPGPERCSCWWSSMTLLKVSTNQAKCNPLWLFTKV